MQACFGMCGILSEWRRFFTPFQELKLGGGQPPHPKVRRSPLKGLSLSAQLISFIPTLISTSDSKHISHRRVLGSEKGKRVILEASPTTQSARTPLSNSGASYPSRSHPLLGTLCLAVPPQPTSVSPANRPQEQVKCRVLWPAHSHQATPFLNTTVICIS